MNIAVAGTGYVGLSIAVLLAQHNELKAVDIVPEKVEKINTGFLPSRMTTSKKYLAEKELHLTATLDGEEAYTHADLVIIAAPTNYDSKKNFFDTSAVEDVIRLVIQCNPDAIMVIKSTVPVGFTAHVRKNTTATTSCSARSSCGSPRPFTTISIPAALLWGRTPRTPGF